MASGSLGDGVHAVVGTKAWSRGVSVLTKKTYYRRDLCEGFYCWQSY